MSEKGKGILSYLLGCVGGLVVLLGMKDSTKETKLHAAQAIVISVGYIILQTAYGFIPVAIPFFYTIIRAIYLIAIIMGIIKVSKEEDPELPVIGGIAKSIFKKIIEEEQ